MDFDRAIRATKEAHQELLRERDSLQCKLEFACSNERLARGEVKRIGDLLRKQVEELKHEVPCPDCKGGIYEKYCPTCMEWHREGGVCLHCISTKVACPTCLGSKLKYFPAVLKAKFVTPPGNEELQAAIQEGVNKVLKTRMMLIESASRNWLAENGSRVYSDLALFVQDGREELRVVSSGEVIFSLPPICDTPYGIPINPGVEHEKS